MCLFKLHVGMSGHSMDYQSCNTSKDVPSNTYAVYKLKGPHIHQGTTECNCSSYMLVHLAAVWAISLAILQKIPTTSKVVGICKGQILKTIMVADLVPLKAILFVLFYQLKNC